MSSVAAPDYTFFDGSQVASITNSGASVAISQTISGLDTGKKYVISYEGSTSLVVAAQRASYAGLTFGSSGGAGYGWTGVFTPPSSSGALSLANIVPGVVAQFDAINVRSVLPNEVITAVFDPSFEGSDATSADGSTSRIAGWTSTGVTGVNPNIAGQSAYANNGAAPDGDKVAFLKATPGKPATLATSTGTGALTVGARYELKFRYNAAGGSGGLDPASMTVTIGSASVVQNLMVTPVGGGNEYYTFDMYFTATSTRNPWLTISNSDLGTAGSSVLLIDGILVTTPEPSSVALLLLGGYAALVRRRCPAATGG